MSIAQLGKRLLMFLLLLVSGVLNAGSKLPPVFSQAYIFGDSLSDVGNLAAVTGDFPFPYYMNRVSNGPVAVEVMAAGLGLHADPSLYLIGPEAGSNYAVAGATATGANAIDLSAQVTAFQANHGFVAPMNALYVIFIGGNDVRDARDETDPVVARSKIKTAVDDVRNAVGSLAQSGARYFMLVNAPNIASIPETHIITDASGNRSVRLRSYWLSQQYRVALHRLSRELHRSYRVKVVEFDLFGYFNKLLKKAGDYGYVYTTEPCFYLQTASFHPACNLGRNADQFVFFDEIHPTARVHRQVGVAFIEALQDRHFQAKRF